MLRATIVGLLMVAATVGSSLADVAGSDFVSLDGTLRHHFAPSGDYAGTVTNPDASVVGVYREGAGVCWLNKDDGSKLMGDLLLYIDQIQCCLSTEPISDKLAFTQVWEKGTGPGYRMCNTQVFRRNQ